MAYEKHVWQCGEAITTEKLNHMEDGIASGGGTDYYLISFETDAETGESNLFVIPNGNYSEEMMIGNGEVDKLPLLYQIFTQEKWIPLGWLGWQITAIGETYARFSDGNGNVIEIDAEGE